MLVTGKRNQSNLATQVARIYGAASAGFCEGRLRHELADLDPSEKTKGGACTIGKRSLWVLLKELRKGGLGVRGEEGFGVVKCGPNRIGTFLSKPLELGGKGAGMIAKYHPGLEKSIGKRPVLSARFDEGVPQVPRPGLSNLVDASSAQKGERLSEYLLTELTVTGGLGKLEEGGDVFVATSLKERLKDDTLLGGIELGVCVESLGRNDVLFDLLLNRIEILRLGTANDRNGEPGQTPSPTHLPYLPESAKFVLCYPIAGDWSRVCKV